MQVWRTATAPPCAAERKADAHRASYHDLAAFSTGPHGVRPLRTKETALDDLSRPDIDLEIRSQCRQPARYSAALIDERNAQQVQRRST